MYNESDVTISIIIPALNEEKNLERLLPYLNEIKDSGVEILVIDGGSIDGTIQICNSNGVKAITAKRKGRAPQMNEGAAIAKGAILYFLHADTFPPKKAFLKIRAVVKNGAESGCFKLRFDSDKKVMKLYSWFTQFDVLPFRFGDQSLFCKRYVFDLLGGFNEELVVMEDNVFIRQLRKRRSFQIMDDYVITSAEKYRQNGFVRLQLIFTLIFCLHYLGVGQEALVGIYREFIKQNKI